MTWSTGTKYLCDGWTRIWRFSHSHNSVLVPLLWLIIGFSTVLKRVALIERELHTLPEFSLSISNVHDFQSLVFVYCFDDHFVSFYSFFFSFGHCIVCGLLHGFWLSLGIYSSSYTLDAGFNYVFPRPCAQD